MGFVSAVSNLDYLSVPLFHEFIEVLIWIVDEDRKFYIVFFDHLESINC